MSESLNNPDLISADPWPVDGISTYSNLHSGKWGILECYADGSFSFKENNPPSKESIIARWGSHLLKNAECGKMTKQSHQINIPVDALFNGKYFVGCAISDEIGIIESVESWDTLEQARMAIFDDKWTRTQETISTPISNPPE